jgi:hypothetical protein
MLNAYRCLLATSAALPNSSVPSIFAFTRFTCLFGGRPLRLGLADVLSTTLSGL